jgi:hypothetical protein
MQGLLSAFAASNAAAGGVDRTGKVKDASVDMAMGMARSGTVVYRRVGASVLCYGCLIIS